MLNNVQTKTAELIYERNRSKMILAQLPEGIIVTDLNGCSDQISVTIGEPEPLTISDLTPDSVVCAEAFIELEATGNGGSSPYIYTWTANGNSLDVGQIITVSPTENNTLYCLTLSEECGSPEVTECLTVTFPTAIVPDNS